MKISKWLRGLMKASALTTVMFIMQACYGSPYGPDNFVEPDEMELTDESTALDASEAPVMDSIAEEVDVITE